jgi:glyoxylase-like metal-dependent hydrolase (beta-lactamase superfamily II)
MSEWRIGDVRVRRIVELEGPVPGTFFYAEGTPENVKRHAWLRPRFATPEGRLVGSIHAFVLESQGRRIVVDTCVGNDKVRSNPNWNRMQTRFLADLEQAGFPAETIDTVVCTHLHVDHVGWNTRLADGCWVPTFPNARYLFGRREFEYWSEADPGTDGDIMGDSVRPITDAGLADLVESDHRITDHVVLEPTPGHTPGHVSVRIRSGETEAVITGDLMHHPIQCAEPDWTVHFDVDSEAARTTRRAFLGKHADSGVLVLGTHFATPTAGRVVSAGSGWGFDTP